MEEAKVQTKINGSGEEDDTHVRRGSESIEGSASAHQVEDGVSMKEESIEVEVDSFAPLAESEHNVQENSGEVHLEHAMQEVHAVDTSVPKLAHPLVMMRKTLTLTKTKTKTMTMRSKHPWVERPNRGRGRGHGRKTITTVASASSDVDSYMSKTTPVRQTTLRRNKSVVVEDSDD